MVEYPYPEALALLEQNVSTAQDRLVCIVSSLILCLLHYAVY